MSRLYGRTYTLRLDRIEIKDVLDIEFKIEKTDKPEPNKAKITVYGLNEDHRGELLRMSGTQIDKSKRKPIRVELDVGYREQHGMIFAGDLRNLEVRQDGVEVQTVVFGHDGGHAFKTSTIERSFAKGTPLATAVRACAEALGVGFGNIDDLSGTATIPGLGKTLPHGIVLHGPAQAQLDRLLKSARLNWSIQHGALVVTEHGKPLERSAIRLGPDSGLIGSPETEVTTDVVPSKGAPPKAKGAIKVKALLNPGFYPKRKIVLDSVSHQGGYVIQEVEFNGSTFADDWFAEMKVVPY
jgi:hypothetical protein